MTCGAAKVRRLSVTDAAFQTMSSLITRWAWHWEEQDGVWKEYGNPVRSVLQFPLCFLDRLPRRMNGFIGEKLPWWPIPRSATG